MMIFASQYNDQIIAQNSVQSFQLVADIEITCAARQQTLGGSIDQASVAHDVDADSGKSLHTGDESFQGSADLSWQELDNQGITGDATWDNDAFKDQNAIEATSDYVGSLESPTAKDVIGADGNEEANDNDMQGDVFQDPLPIYSSCRKLKMSAEDPVAELICHAMQ